MVASRCRWEDQDLGRPRPLWVEDCRSGWEQQRACALTEAVDSADTMKGSRKDPNGIAARGANAANDAGRLPHVGGRIPDVVAAPSNHQPSSRAAIPGGQPVVRACSYAGLRA